MERRGRSSSRRDRPRISPQVAKVTPLQLPDDCSRALQGAGDPADEILKTARAEHCDLIAMTTHGRPLLSDLIYGTTITKVRHEAGIPIFLVKVQRE